jgi:hypothetical protein
MKSQSELLKVMVETAKDRGFSIIETPRSFDFYKDEVLIDRFYKFSVDYTLSDAEFNRRIDYLETF